MEKLIQRLLKLGHGDQQASMGAAAAEHSGAAPVKGVKSQETSPAVFVNTSDIGQQQEELGRAGHLRTALNKNQKAQ